jgi:hypothetical protein
MKKKSLFIIAQYLMLPITVFAQQASEKEEESLLSSKNDLFNGWSLRLSEYGQVSGSMRSLTSNDAAAYLSLHGSIRYGNTVGDSSFWLGTELSPLNFTLN